MNKRIVSTMNIGILTSVFLLVAFSTLTTPVNSYDGYGGMYHRRTHLEYSNIIIRWLLYGMLKPENRMTVFQ